MFFKPAVNELEKSGHEVLITSRNYRECNQLAKIKNLNLTIVGKHGGDLKYQKLRQSAHRTYLLAEIVNKFNPCISVSYSSPEATRVAFGLGIRTISLNDSPHSYSVNKLSIPLTNYLLCPWIIPYKAWSPFGIHRNQIIRYKALDPVAWLRSYRSEGYTRKDLFGKNKLLKEWTILIRPTESAASYISTKNIQSNLCLMDSIVSTFHRASNIIFLCRYQDQVVDFSNRYRGRAIVSKETMDGLELISICDVFVGGGGTMSAEAALMGKPVISIAPIRFYINDYLTRLNLIWQISDKSALLKLLTKLQENSQMQITQQRLAKKLMDKMEDPIEILLDTINIVINKAMDRKIHARKPGRDSFRRM
jgi:predicted glycosyltransferase